VGEEQDSGLGVQEPGSGDGRCAARSRQDADGSRQWAIHNSEFRLQTRAAPSIIFGYLSRPYRVPRKHPEFALSHESLKVLAMEPIEWRKRKQRMRIDAAFAFPEIVGPQRVGATGPSATQKQGEKVGLLPNEIRFSVDGEKVQLGEKVPNPQP